MLPFIAGFVPVTCFHISGFVPVTCFHISPDSHVPVTCFHKQETLLKLGRLHHCAPSVTSTSSFSRTTTVSSLTHQLRAHLHPPLMHQQRLMARTQPFSFRNSTHWHRQRPALPRGLAVNHRAALQRAHSPAMQRPISKLLGGEEQCTPAPAPERSQGCVASAALLQCGRPI